MAAKLTRRKVLATGGITAGAYMTTAYAEKQETAHSQGAGWQGTGWSRGPDRDLVRDLKPGPTPVKLACSSHTTRLWYPTDKSITEAVKSIRDQGYTSTGTSYRKEPRNEWLYCPDSDIVELKEALKKYDVEFFDMMVWTNMIHPDRKTRQENLKYIAEVKN